MASASHHYDTHLGPVYSWMLGDPAAAADRAVADIESLGLPAIPQGIAVDLGAGTGLHAIALASRGYRVTAIDSCERLLDELRVRAAGSPVTAVRADLLSFPQIVPGPLDVILCMGDTLTHLQDLAAVETLFAAVAASLAGGGTFAATWRDYSRAAEGTSRFIPVRSDADRILTCFLEFLEERVLVHDLLHERIEGSWRLRVSCYPKLRLGTAWVTQRLQEQGLQVRTATRPNGMIQVIATKL